MVLFRKKTIKNTKREENQYKQLQSSTLCMVVQLWDLPKKIVATSLDLTNLYRGDYIEKKYKKTMSNLITE